MPDQPSEPSPPQDKTTSRTLIFMVILSLVCALILSILASALRTPQEQAKEIDRSRQMLISARIISPYEYFQMENEKGEVIPAKFSDEGTLIPSDQKIKASDKEILSVYKKRIHPFLVNDKGEETTFQAAGINEDKYLADYRKTGYYLQPWKLIYKITSNSKAGQLEGYVIPVNGMGLWDAIYGYLAIKPNVDTVIGISWYDQKETPGLGANISEPDWQSQFADKRIFMQATSGQADLQTAPLGITVVKGKVSEVLGTSPKSLSAVDGMAGATLTGNGVTSAYRDVLAAYRPFLLHVHKTAETDKSKTK